MSIAQLTEGVPEVDAPETGGAPRHEPDRPSPPPKSKHSSEIERRAASTQTVKQKNTEADRLEAAAAEAARIVAVQDDSALVERKTKFERFLDRRAVRVQRGRDRRAQLRTQRADHRRTKKLREQESKSADAESSDERWHIEAKRRAHRLTSPSARLARLARRSVMATRIAVGVVLIGMVWSGINVQRNLVPHGDASDVLFWVSYIVELMISGCLVMIMIADATFTEFGRKFDHKKTIAIEIGLISLSLFLTSGEHWIRGDAMTGFECAIGPIMVANGLWIHALVSRRYATLLSEVAPVEPGQSRLDSNTTELLVHIRRGFDFMERGVLKPSQAPDGGGAPASGALAKALNLSKPDACDVRDGMKEWIKAGLAPTADQA